MAIEFRQPDPDLAADEFLDLVQRVWPGEYESGPTQMALERTINVTAWDDGYLVGSVRLLTDGYFFNCISEILVDPDYQRRGIGRELMERIEDESPGPIFLGAQPGNEPFFEKLGYDATMQGFQKKPERNTNDE